MLHNSQFNYDNAVEPELHDYRDEPMFLELAEWVTLELACGRDWQNLSSEIMSTYLDYTDRGYQMALEWVSERLTEKQYLEYLEELN